MCNCSCPSVSLFDQAVDVPQAERAHFVSQRSGDDLDLPGRIRELFLAKPGVFRSADAKYRRDNFRAVMNLNPGFPAAVVTTEEVEIKGIQDAWNAVAERRRPDADRLPGSGASLGYGRGRRPGPLTSDPGNQPALTAAAAGLNHDEHIPWIAIYPAAQIQARLARVMPDGLDAFEKKMRLPGPMGRGERQVSMNPERRLVGKEKSTGEQEGDRPHRSQLVPSYRAGGQDTADLQVADRLLRLREGPVKEFLLKLRPLRRSPRLRGKLFAELDNIGELALEVTGDGATRLHLLGVWSDGASLWRDGERHSAPERGTDGITISEDFSGRHHFVLRPVSRQ